MWVTWGGGWRGGGGRAGARERLEWGDSGAVGPECMRGVKCKGMMRLARTGARSRRLPQSRPRMPSSDRIEF